MVIGRCLLNEIYSFYRTFYEATLSGLIEVAILSKKFFGVTGGSAVLFEKQCFKFWRAISRGDSLEGAQKGDLEVHLLDGHFTAILTIVSHSRIFSLRRLCDSQITIRFLGFSEQGRPLAGSPYSP